jgi:DNA processing protein
VADTDVRHARVLALAEVLSPSLNGQTSHLLSDLIEAGALDDESVLDLLGKDVTGWWVNGMQRTPSSRITYWLEELARLRDSGVWMVDAGEEEYPANLRMIHNRPPFLMVRGSLRFDDERAIAVVGTRHPSEDGRENAYRLAGQLASKGVTVVSGLAEGVDTAAHAGALSTGGRTIAVFGTGIEVVFPAKNRALAGSVADSGAYVSQFWPSMRGARWTFPVRNLVTSGLSLGTVVVEAGETSGARLQAEAARLHGKRVFLLRQLVESQPWAREIMEKPGVLALDCVDDVIAAIDLDLATDATVLI